MTKEIGDLRLAYLRLRAESKKNKKYALESQQAIEALKKEIAMLRKGGGAGGRGGGEGGGGKELELTERVREERERRKQVEERVEKAERELKELKDKRRETGVEEVSLFESFVSFPHSRVRNSVSLRGPDTYPPSCYDIYIFTRPKSHAYAQQLKNSKQRTTDSPRNLKPPKLRLKTTTRSSRNFRTRWIDGRRLRSPRRVGRLTWRSCRRRWRIWNG